MEVFICSYLPRWWSVIRIILCLSTLSFITVLLFTIYVTSPLLRTQACQEQLHRGQSCEGPWFTDLWQDNEKDTKMVKSNSLSVFQGFISKTLKGQKWKVPNSTAASESSGHAANGAPQDLCGRSVVERSLTRIGVPWAIQRVERTASCMDQWASGAVASWHLNQYMIYLQTCKENQKLSSAAKSCQVACASSWSWHTSACFGTTIQRCWCLQRGRTPLADHSATPCPRPMPSLAFQHFWFNAKDLWFCV